MKHLLTIIALVLVLAACSKNGTKETEKTVATTAEIEAAMMEGRNMARDFVGKQFADSLQLSSQLLEVSVKRGEYAAAGRKDECAAFDSAFISTVRAVRPGLAEEIERVRPQ